MCGIVGFNWVDRSLAKRMSDTIVHRGPDDYCIFTDSGITLGMRRLSIIDLTRGIYPLKNENQDVFMVFNGEIYNFKELRAELEKKGHSFETECDGEVIVHAYEEYQEHFLGMLRGMFAIALYDAKNKKLILARDQIGVKPLYYHFNNSHLVFASEIKPILELNTIKKELNKQALNQYFALRYNPDEETIFKGIKKLLPGHFLKLDMREKSMIIGKYWDINFNRKEKHSMAFYEKKILELLKASVKEQLISDVPLGVFLSGGLDSSSIVAMMSEIKKENNSDASIRTYSVGFANAEKVNETSYAKQVSDFFSTEHQEIIIEPDVVKLLPKIIWHTDEPMADAALIPVYLLSEAAKKTSTVILTGDGGDEIFAGYDQYRFLKATHSASKIPLFKQLAPVANKTIPLKVWDKFYKHSSNLGKAAYRRGDLVIKSIKSNKAKAYYNLTGMFDDEERKELLKSEHYEQINYEKMNNEFFKNKQDYLSQVQYFDFKRLLPESFLMKTDRMTLAKSIESRVPLLDQRIVELAFSMPANFKLRGGTTKFIFKKALAKKLPSNIIWRKKQSFHVPVENWLNNELKGTVSDALNITKIYKQGILNPYQLKKIIENYDKGKLYYPRQIWTLLNFELWHKTFMEDEKLRF